MKKQIVFIFTNGELSLSRILIPNNTYVIGVDRAAYVLIKNKIYVDAAVGDFDSTNKNEYREIRKNVKNILKFEPEKNETDTELALKYAIGLHPKNIRIYGAIGSRVDHVLASIGLLETYSSYNIDIQIIDEKNILQVVTKEIYLKKYPALPYFSLLSLTDRSIVSIRGSKYDVCETVFRRGSTLGVSNEIVDPRATMTVHAGKVLVMRSRD